jgi:hypothetical protein
MKIFQTPVPATGVRIYQRDTTQVAYMQERPEAHRVSKFTIHFDGKIRWRCSASGTNVINRHKPHQAARQTPGFLQIFKKDFSGVHSPLLLWSCYVRDPSRYLGPAGSPPTSSTAPAGADFPQTIAVRSSKICGVYRLSCALRDENILKLKASAWSAQREETVT